MHPCSGNVQIRQELIKISSSLPERCWKMKQIDEAFFSMTDLTLLLFQEVSICLRRTAECKFHLSTCFTSILLYLCCTFAFLIAVCIFFQCKDSTRKKTAQTWFKRHESIFFAHHSSRRVSEHPYRRKLEIPVQRSHRSAACPMGERTIGRKKACQP